MVRLVDRHADDEGTDSVVSTVLLSVQDLPPQKIRTRQESLACPFLSLGLLSSERCNRNDLSTPVNRTTQEVLSITTLVTDS